MFLHITKAEYLAEYKIKVSFNNGHSGIVDLKHHLNGDMFEPLKEIEQFKNFRVDPEIETIVWENGADLAPEFLFEICDLLAVRDEL
ncbi:DUF2442 domain-containing protein [Chitinispirillales bacterium ANBcel5]|uniref:DUF2442 domain-containing protein n=1 Tax=Cellulosispirillum alkaliphilum TaxID=3039283 RepID=UPI002A51596E|nr:DUF2442 domain-containing protein [Chitinispirillales bacterium ANBcel5]